MNQKARATLQYVSLPERCTDLYFWSELLRRDLFFLTVSVIELIVDGTVIFPPAFLAFL